jgi:ribosomal protein L31E
MTGPSDGDAVGYGRPPKNTRWKRGQSGNPRKVRPKQDENMVSLIDRLLVASVNIVKNGVPTRMSAMNAIIHQLLQKSLSGNKKAERALREFEAFASRNMTKQLEIVFVDNEYTTAFAAAQPEDKSV